MSRYTKHIVIHTDVIIEAENKEEAQKMFEEVPLLTDSNENIEFDGIEIDELTGWMEV